MNSQVRLSFVLIVAFTALAACGGGGGGGGGSSPNGGGGGGGGGGNPPPSPQTLTIGGSVTGLAGTGLVLQNNSGDDLAVAANGSFVFASALTSGARYSVSIKTHPSYPAQECAVTNGSGTATATVTTVAVACTNLPVATAVADAAVHGATVTWSNAAAASANLYVSSARNCDIRNYASCPDGALITGISSPHAVKNLRNGQAYFFQVESVFANGARGVSKETGAQPNVIAFDREVNAIAPKPDGSVYVGGEFTRVGVVTGSAVPLDLADGRLARPDFPVVVGSVFAVTSDGAGGWYVGGKFASVGGVPRRNLAHVRANGEVNPDWNPLVNGNVLALALVGDTLYVGGDFTTVNKAARSGLAALDSRADVTDWNPSPNGLIYAIEPSGTTLYVGGEFTAIGGTARNYLAAFNASGAVTAWNPSPNATVGALEASGDVLYAGGLFTTFSGTPRNHVAEITSAGAVTAWNPNADNAVWSIAAAGSTVYIGGTFNQVGSTTRRYLAAIDKNGAVTAWDPAANNFVMTLRVVDNTVFAGGFFTMMGDTRRQYLAAIDSSGAVTSWNPTPNGEVLALDASVRTSGGELYAGGDFKMIGGVTRGRLAQLDATGAWTAWNPDVSGSVRALAIIGDLVYVGGSFASIGGVARNFLGAIDANGAPTAFNPKPNNSVYALLGVDGRLFVGGAFSTMLNNVIGRNHLACFDRNGELEAPFGSGEGTNGSVSALAKSDDGPTPTIYIGGAFTMYGATPRSRLAAIQANGVLVQNWNPSANGDVFTLAAAGGFIYAGGLFDVVGGVPRNRIAAILANGDLTVWDPNANGAVRTLGVAGTGASTTIYAGGGFTSIGGAPRNYLAGIGPTGVATSWNPTPDAGVSVLAIDGGKVHVGGPFNLLGTSPRAGFGVVEASGTGAVIP